MTTLYPRLPPGPARRLFDEIHELPIDLLRLRSGAEHPSTVYTPIGGERVTETAMQQIRDDLLRIAINHGYPGTDTAARGAFDLALARYLHDETDLAPAEAGARDGGVWAHLALVTAPDVAVWRFPNAHPDRLLGSDLTRHVFARMWWRAHLVYDDASLNGDPYEALTVMGEDAIDRLLTRRRFLGQSPCLFRAVLRVWSTVDRGDLAERRLLEDFLKRLLRLFPFIAFEALPQDQLDSQLQAVVAEAQKALTDGKQLEEEGSR